MNKSLFEYINSIALYVVYWINKIPNTKNSNYKIILCYHSIGNSNWRFSTPVSDFREQVNYLTHNYKIKSVLDLLDLNKKGVAITFDDGYLDVYENALPILEKNKISATMFVLGDPGSANRKELDNELRLMSIEQIKHLHDLGWEIGCHTNTHADLHSLSKEELIKEIVLSKKSLEKKLGFKIRYFAYPKGKYNKKIIDVVRNAGYDAAFTVDGGFLSLRNKMLITRLPMEGVVSIGQFSTLLSPLGLAMEGIFMKILQIKEKIQSKVN